MSSSISEISCLYSKKKKFFFDKDRKKRLLENLIWKKMTENALSQMNNQNVYVDRMQVMRSTYTESFVKEGFVPKELGTEIDEKV